MCRMYVLKFNPKPFIITLILVIAFSLGYFVPKNFAEEAPVNLPVIMYHQVLKDPARHGTYVISPNELEYDILYLKRRGYNFVTPSQLVDYVYSGKALPDKPIMLTFDDGFATGLHYVLPILEKHGAKAVISSVTIHSETYSNGEDHELSYAHLTWEEMKKLSDSGIVEMGNHTYNMHASDERKGINILDGEDTEKYKELLKKDLTKAQEQLENATGIIPSTFAYPFGNICAEAEEVIKEIGFKVTLSCTEGVSIITKDKNSLYNLKRFNRPHNIDRYEFFRKMGI